MGPDEKVVDQRYSMLRAACIRLRAYAYKLTIQPRATIRAQELYERIDAALYPTDEDRRREPLDVLLDAARKDEAGEWRALLEDVRDQLALLGPALPDAKLRDRVAEIMQRISAHARRES